MSPITMISRYFDLLAEPMFVTGDDGRETFHAFGQFARGYVVPDAATGARLRRSVKWTYGWMFVALGLLTMPLSATFGIGLGGAIAGVLLLIGMLGRFGWLARGLELSNRRLTVGTAIRNSAEKFSASTLWTLVALGVVMTTFMVWAAVAPFTPEIADTTTRVVFALGAVFMGFGTLVNGLSAARRLR